MRSPPPAPGGTGLAGRLALSCHSSDGTASTFAPFLAMHPGQPPSRPYPILRIGPLIKRVSRKATNRLAHFLGQDLLGKAAGLGLGNEFTNPLQEIFTCSFSGARIRPIQHHCAAASSQIQPSFVRENSISLGDRVVVDPKIHG